MPPEYLIAGAVSLPGDRHAHPVLIADRRDSCGLCRRGAVPAAEHAKARHTCLLPIRQLRHGEPDKTCPEALWPDDQVVRQVRLRCPFVLQHRVVRAVLARLKQPSRAEFPLLDIPPAPRIALRAGARRQLLHRAEVVGKIHLHSIYRAVFLQIHRQRLRGVVRGSLPPVLHIFIDRVCCRLLRALLAGRRDRLPVGEQHPGRLREGIPCESVGVRRPVSIPLIAEQRSIPVKAGRPDADAPLKCVIHRDPHRRGVPPASLPILHRGAMSRARHKSARLIGERIVRRRPERSERGIPLIHAVRVDIIFRPRAGILQIIPAPVLCHPGALNIRRIRHGHLRHLPLLRWQRPDRLLHHLHRHLGRIQPRLLRDHGLHDFEDRAASRLVMMILSDPLISQPVMAVADEDLRLPDPVHRLRIEFHAPDRRDIAAAPVEI